MTRVRFPPRMLVETPAVSDRQIAAGLGIDHKTVGAQRATMESTGEIPQFKTNIGADGKERPREVARKPITVFNPTARDMRALQNPAVVVYNFFMVTTV